MPDRGKRIVISALSEDSKIITGGSAMKLSATIQKSSGAIAELHQNTEGLKEYDQLLASNNNLQNELERKSNEVKVKIEEIVRINQERKNYEMQMEKKLEEQIDFKSQLIQLYEERYSAWEKEKEYHSKDSEELSP
ncbi:hypothetical protein DM02DRAFT_684432 [Periconia macrospinosa]|uniref:Uncharacterized protein n=1 Tax=Periconia macrospinosa TaxID=97972 RepID=A0A2V1CYC0_9PLEO|nr:hypothetical protein DM02DRAFT_684432 [Periconia macrospinosa]